MRQKTEDRRQKTEDWSKRCHARPEGSVLVLERSGLLSWSAAVCCLGTQRSAVLERSGLLSWSAAVFCQGAQRSSVKERSGLLSSSWLHDGAVVADAELEGVERTGCFDVTSDALRRGHGREDGIGVGEEMLDDAEGGFWGCDETQNPGGAAIGQECGVT